MDDKKLKALQETVQAIQISNEKIVGHLGEANNQNKFKEVAADRKEKKNEAAAVKRDKEQTVLLQDIAAGVKKLGSGISASFKKLVAPILAGVSAAVALVVAPIVILANFFKQLKAEIAFLKSLKPGFISKLV